MPNALLTQKSVDEFRRWLQTMPPSRWERRVVGACDASLENSDRKISPQRAARMLRFLHGRLNDADFDHAAKLIANIIDETLVEPHHGGNGRA
jgi:hypothetical protein